MKKIFLLIFIIVSLSTVTLAYNMELQYDGETHIYNGPEVNLILNNKKFVPSEEQMPPVIIQDRTLVPVREVFEKLDGKVEWDAEDKKVSVTLDEQKIELWINKTTALVNGKEVDFDVPPKLINSKTMVPIRFISENGGLNVEWEAETTTVSVTRKEKDEKIVKIKAVSVTKINNIDCVVVDLDIKTTYKTFEVKAEEDRPNRIILDIENSKFDFNYETIILDNNNFIQQLRFGVQENNVNRIVLDMKKDVDYSVIQNDDGTQIFLGLAQNFVVDNDNNGVNTDIPNILEQNSDENNNEKPTNTEPPVDEEPIEPNINEETNISSSITSMKYSTASDKVRIILDGKFEYEITELESPKRIVLDFIGSDLKLDGPSEINLKNKAISTIEASNNENGTARIVIKMSDRSSYELSKKTSELQIKVEEPSYKGVEYSNKGDYAEIILSNVDLNDLTKLQSKNTKKYTIKYSSSKFNPGSGAIEIDDDYVKKISVTSTKIAITDAGNMRYTAIQRGSDVVFTIKKSSSEDERIIILDAGHGGDDPGAINGTSQEKTYNLKILLKLKEMLEDAGYTVYATRESDVTLTVNDRVYLATKDYPEASLYVSIHNNSLENKNYSGTLVMYCSRDTSSYGITNKEFATYVLNELVDNLGTINRGFIEVKENDTSKRVLTEVQMPSILCEIAFVSNDNELARLKTDKFQTLAAEAIFNGIQKALNKMD